MQRRTLAAHAMAFAAACVLASCGGGGGSGGSGGGGGGITNPPVVPPPPPPPTLPDPATAPALKTVIAGRFGVVNYPVGAAIEPASTTGGDATLLARHMSSLTAENAMKPDTIWPNQPGTQVRTATPNFAPADQIVAFANANGMRVRGHTLLWHQTAPSWFFAGDQSDPVAYRAAVRERLRDYIHTVMAHFPEVYAWDVVNEVASDTPNDPNPYRTNSPWYTAYSVGGAGSEYVRDAFLFATEARALMSLTSADMKLMINDYSTESPGKRANLLAIVRDVMNAGTGADINGVGHQLHLQRGADVAQVIAAFAAVEAESSTLENHVTELDVSIYMDPGNCFSQRTIPPCSADYGANPPQAALSEQATLYRALFTAFARPSVTSVTTWGIADNHTWLNSWPVTRVNRPLLFDTNRNPKWAFWTVVDPAIVVP